MTIALRQPNNRSNHMAITLSSGEVVLIGGVSKRSSVGYDPGTGRWRTIGPPKLPAAGQATALLTDGRVLVCGGFEAGGVIGTEAVALDPVGERWQVLAPLQGRRAFHSATALADSRILVVGGRAGEGATVLSPDNSLHPGSSRQVGPAERFDPRLGAWVSAGALFTPRASHTATRLSDGRVLVVGGVGQSDRAIADVERYDPQNDTWQIVAPLIQARADHATVLLPDGEVLVIGGIGTLGNTPGQLHVSGGGRRG